MTTERINVLDEVSNVLNGLGRPRLLVVGDLMLDEYTFGEAERVSPEAPVLVIRADDFDACLGGAASVAGLVCGLEAHAVLAGAVGDDESGRRLLRLLAEAGVDRSAVVCDPTRPSTVKHRFLARPHGVNSLRRAADPCKPSQVGCRPLESRSQQALRVDRESRRPLPAELEAELIGRSLDLLGECQAVLISDYGKGVCTPRVLECVTAAAARRGLPVLVDPARQADYRRYAGAALIKPNRVEAAWAAGQEIGSFEEAGRAGKELCRRFEIGVALVTLDAEGMVFTDAAGNGAVLPAHALSACDVTGAGDTVLAVAGVLLAEGLPLAEAARRANAAAGLQVERLGVARLTRAEIEEAIAAGPPRDLTSRGRGRRKTVSVDEAAALAAECRSQGQRVVFTNGCFDLCHTGHVATLQAASLAGDVLFVGVNSDKSVRLLKGPRRPIIDEQNRAAMLAALECVDYVVVFDDSTPHELLRLLQPDVLVKGGTYSPDEVIGREIVEGYGGKVLVTSHVPGVSTTEILNVARALRDPCRDGEVVREPCQKEVNHEGHQGHGVRRKASKADELTQRIA